MHAQPWSTLTAKIYTVCEKEILSSASTSSMYIALLRVYYQLQGIGNNLEHSLDIHEKTVSRHQLIATNQQVCKGYDYKILNSSIKLFHEIYNYGCKPSLLPKWFSIRIFLKPHTSVVRLSSIAFTQNDGHIEKIIR